MQCRKHADCVVVSIYVNPTQVSSCVPEYKQQPAVNGGLPMKLHFKDIVPMQFAQHEDFGVYPRQQVGASAPPDKIPV